MSVSITGPDQLEPDEIAIYTFEIHEEAQGGLQVGAGMNASLFLDSVQHLIDAQMELDPDFPPNLQILDGEVTHGADVNVAQAPNGGVGVFFYDVPIQAPSQTGTLEIRAAMNSFNQNFNSMGDHWENTAKTVTVPEPGSAAGLVASIGLLAMLRTKPRKNL